MYTIFANGNVIHHPMLADKNLVVSEPVLREKLNTHGSLQFVVPPEHPHYREFLPRKMLVTVISDTLNNRPWFGRVISTEKRINGQMFVYCEGELGCLVDAVYQPFGFTGAPDVFFGRVFLHYIQQAFGDYSYPLEPGQVTVTDPNNNIVRSSKNPMNLWDLFDEKLFGSSLGGYIVPRYDKTTGKHYVDYLSDFDTTSSQKVIFGENMLDFTEHITAEDVITALYPYGAELDDTSPDYAPDPPTNGAWNGNRLTVASVNDGRVDIADATGVSLWGPIFGWKIWDDITLPQNLLRSARAWLAQQIWQSITIEVSAVDLSFVNADIEQIQVGEYVWVESKAHDVNARLLCTEKLTYLTHLEDSLIVLGAGQKTLTDIAGGDAK